MSAAAGPRDLNLSFVHRSVEAAERPAFNGAPPRNATSPGKSPRTPPNGVSPRTGTSPRLESQPLRGSVPPSLELLIAETRAKKVPDVPADRLAERCPECAATRQEVLALQRQVEHRVAVLVDHLDLLDVVVLVEEAVFEGVGLLGHALGEEVAQLCVQVLGARVRRGDGLGRRAAVLA